MRRLVFLACLSLAAAVSAAAAWQEYAGRPGTTQPVAEQSRPARDELALDPLILPVLQEGKVTHRLAVDLTLQFADPAVKAQALAVMPRLQDALLAELHSLYSLRRVRNAGYDSLLVKERLALAGERILGAGEIAGLTLTVSESAKTGI